MKTTNTQLNFLDFPFIYQTQQINLKAYCALGTPSTLKQQYLIQLK